VKTERGHNVKKRTSSKTFKAYDPSGQEACGEEEASRRAQEAARSAGRPGRGAQGNDFSEDSHAPEATEADGEDLRVLSDTGSALIQCPDGWRLFSNPEEIITTDDPGRVVPCLADAESAANSGRHVAGFVSYEAGPGLDSALSVIPSDGMPLLWFGVYRTSRQVVGPPSDVGSYTIGDWKPSVLFADYSAALARIKEYISAGDTYQVNYTIRLNADFSGDPVSLFGALCDAQRSQYAAYINTGTHAICSASPELFFSLDGDQLVSKPMKGTAPRGLRLREDIEQRNALKISDKNRAENVMIVDMIRNDMGRVARQGTVVPEELFTVEKYPTVFQMISTVRCKTSSSFVDIMRAMFPCASITGAPKVRTTEIITELESGPRGLYTGCIGYLLPGQRASFNVAIRTVVIDRATGLAEYGVGGGIVWDSLDRDEHAECGTKAALLTAKRPAFELLETILLEEGEYFLLDLHMARLSESAAYFDFAVDTQVVLDRLSSFAGRTDGRQRVRLLCAEDGSIHIESSSLGDDRGGGEYRLKLAKQSVDSRELFLYHKTTHRVVYEDAKACCEDCDDVILWNESGEITETTIANIVIEKDGRKITPRVDSGLLAGTYRAHLLATGEIEEGVVTKDDLASADAIYIVNSVRKWVSATLVAGVQ